MFITLCNEAHDCLGTKCLGLTLDKAVYPADLQATRTDRSLNKTVEVRYLQSRGLRYEALSACLANCNNRVNHGCHGHHGMTEMQVTWSQQILSSTWEIMAKSRHKNPHPTSYEAISHRTWKWQLKCLRLEHLLYKLKSRSWELFSL